MSAKVYRENKNEINSVTVYEVHFLPLKPDNVTTQRKILQTKVINVPQTMLKALVSLVSHRDSIIRTLSAGELARL